MAGGDWASVMSAMMGGHHVDPKAMASLGEAQWRDFSRSMWGPWMPEPRSTGGVCKTLRGRAEGTGLTRRARLFTPDGLAEGAPLVVMLHGCMQDAESFARLTRMDELAKREGFAVLYPDQESSANAMQCWNWNAPENQRRLGGEPEALASLLGQAQRLRKTPARLTRVAGISAGGALAATMAHLYPELIGSVAVVAGPAPFVAASMSQALGSMAHGPGDGHEPAALLSAQEAGRRSTEGRRRLPMLIVQGLADSTVHPKNALVQERAAIMLNDALDDGSVTGSLREIASKVADARGVARVWRDGEGSVVAAVLAPTALGHAWSGGDGREPFAQEGFDQSRLALDFFEAAESGDWSGFDAKSLAARVGPPAAPALAARKARRP